jgi:hypothetical protein
MRLNFNNIGRGLEAIAGAKQARDLAQTSARFDVTEGAYGPGLQENITQLEGLKAQDPAQAAAYDQAIGELTRRQGLTAPDYSIASGPTNFATRQEARQAAAPLRAEGLAGVYRQYGDVERADALETRAFEQQRALAAEERAKAAEARNVQDFANRSTLTGLEINAKTQTAAESQKMTDFNAWRSQNPNAGFAEINAEMQRLGMGVEQQFKVASNLTGIGEQEFKASQQRIRKLVENQGLDGLLKAHKESNDLDPGSHFEVIRGKGGKVSLNRVDTATGQVIQPNVFSGSEAETTAYLNKAAMDPATIIDYTMNLEKTRAAIDKDKASADKDRALGDRYRRDGETEKGLTKKVADVEASLGRKLTEPEKLTLFGLSAKPSDRPALSASDVTARAKALVESRTPSLSNPKKPMTMTEAITFVEGGMRNPIAERLDAALGGGGDPFAPPAAPTRPSAAAPATAPAPRQTGSAGIDTSRPRTDVNPVTNLPREAPASAPNLVSAAARGLDAGQARYVAYLEAKIAARERLTPDETARAKRFGLVP